MIIQKDKENFDQLCLGLDTILTHKEDGVPPDLKVKDIVVVHETLSGVETGYKVELCVEQVKQTKDDTIYVVYVVGIHK